MADEARDPAHLSDMLRAGEAVMRFVQGRTFEDLLKDDMLQASVERKIEIVGEAARRVSATFQGSHPEIEWRKIIATRHIFAHDYDEIDYEVVWRIATVHVPALVTQLRGMGIEAGGSAFPEANEGTEPPAAG